MRGARDYARLFKTGQYGQLYIVSGNHARGRTFRIFILPEGEDGLGNGENNPPLNKYAVEVYGVISGNPGWTEEYGWIHIGKWQDDFNKLAESKAVEIINRKKMLEEAAETERLRSSWTTKIILEGYK